MIARLSPSGAAEQPPATDLARGYLCAVAGKMKNIPEWLREGNIPDWLPGYGMAYAVYGKALLARGDYPALMELAEKMQSHRGCATLLFARIHALVFQAAAAQRLDGPEAGASALLEALELSEPDGLVFCLAEYGAEMSALLRDGVDRDDGRLEQIRSLAGMMGRMWRGDGGSGLTPREQSVMKLVVKGMSTPAIARRLKIAVVTVKKALGRAYSKLGARNRAEAAINYRQAYRAVPTKM